MHRSILALLECPVCRSPRPFDLAVEWEVGEEVEDGRLVCPACRSSFAIRRGIPRFVGADASQFKNFGFQWQRWRTIQIDRLSGHGLSERRFFADSRWEAAWLKDKWILDAGCGAGRFADVVALHGANVVACDISEAVDAARETLVVHGSRVAVLQASIDALPLRAGVFDGVYCMGVIQHTPDPPRTMRALPRYLKPGGRLVYNFYEAGWRARAQVVKYGLRLITPHLPASATLALSRALVAMFFPLSAWLSKIRYVRQINHFLPICAVHDPALTREQQRAWTLLDTFDWYSPRYEKRQDHRAVVALLKDLGLDDVSGESGLAWARKPVDGATG